MHDEIVAELSDAFDKDLADAVTEFTGTRITETGNYDPVTETIERITANYEGRGIFSRFKESLVDDVLVMATDKRLLMLQDEVTDKPKIGDVINDMKVLDVAEDPVNATWRVHLRVI